ncbi:hypothetical protein AGDE_14690 [Angomonas deanei]|nr:hypothetical protein AGDE_14690 [Angomonas deanei]|eukprot:EPY20420.1 hypothetical protein AGDE_14690 [Angomonas deanei]
MILFPSHTLVILFIEMKNKHSWDVLLRKDVIRQSTPPPLLAVQLAGANFCATLSHRLMEQTAPKETEDAAASGVVHQLRGDLARHYGSSARVRGAQKPLGPAFRSHSDRLAGRHSGRARSIWKLSKVNRFWCKVCATPLVPGKSTTTVRVERNGKRKGTKTLTACRHCLAKVIRECGLDGPPNNRPQQQTKLLTRTALSSCVVRHCRRKRTRRGKNSHPKAMALKDVVKTSVIPTGSLRGKRTVRTESVPVPPVPSPVVSSLDIKMEKKKDTPQVAKPAVVPTAPTPKTVPKTVGKKEEKKKKVSNLMSSLGL